MDRPDGRLAQPLNAADRFLLAVDRAQRRIGGVGFETQTLIGLGGRADLPRLRDALAGLARRHPGLTSRLVEAQDQGGPYWQFRPGSDCPLVETDLADGDPQCVLDHAARLLSAPSDPVEVDPARFHLLRRPDGRDVLLVQFNHALVDHHGAMRLLGCLARPDAGGQVEPAPAPAWRDPIWEHLRRFPRKRRKEAMRAAEDWRRSLRGGAIHLGRTPPGGGPVTLRLISRRLEAGPARALEAHVRACGAPSLAMAVLASAFRAISRLRGAQATGRYFNVGLGVDLGLSRAEGPALQNLTTLLPLRASREEVEEGGDLARVLVRRLRELLARDMDPGVLELAAVFGRLRRQGDWAIELLLRYCLSLWFAYFGAVRELGPELCGARIEEVRSFGPTWPPVGLTLLVNQFDGRLLFQLTHAPECVPAALADAFLDETLADLTTLIEGGACAGSPG